MTSLAPLGTIESETSLVIQSEVPDREHCQGEQDNADNCLPPHTSLPNPFVLCAPRAEPVAAQSSPPHPLVAAATENSKTWVNGPTPPDLGCMPDIPAFLDRRKKQ